VSARRHPERTAIRVPGGRSLSYRELAALSDLFRDHLWRLGVVPGDRVGLRLHKSLDAVVAIFGILKAGAAYVPVDADSPVARGAFILDDCSVRAVVTERRLEDPLVAELRVRGATPAVIAFNDEGAGLAVQPMLEPLPPVGVERGAHQVHPAGDDLAYILYTSGSTGNPKGVMLTHGNAESFLRWCAETFEPGPADVFSSHAPFHFDLSILDIFLPISHGAALVLIGESLGKDPMRLAASISAECITIWYSTPSILSLLAQYGKLERYDYSKLRTVLFAGEVFPVPQFRRLHHVWRWPRYFNLYGPTETNVCTCYGVPQDESWSAMDTFPIGRVCPPNCGRVIDEAGREVRRGDPGELVVSGPNVMKGYWNRPELTRDGFLSFGDGGSWYRTGDIVREGEDGEYRYLGRRDRMVKRRGYRVELGEIEAALMRHPSIAEAAVVAARDVEGTRIGAFVRPADGGSLSIVSLKTFSSQCLPTYMIPDVFIVVEALPRTSTNKVDLQVLVSRLQRGEG
jgi:amino acid adenylation domain-containing protein